MKNPNRRGVLSGLGVIGCSIAANPLMTPMTLASVPSDNRLVVIVLRGAMDGLDVIRPVGDPLLKTLRPKLAAMVLGEGHAIDPFYRLNPALSDLVPLWKQGELAFAQAVSTPYRDKRSHFDGQDLLEAGTGMDVPLGLAREGWLNRLLQSVPHATSRTAFAVGREEMRLLSGRAPYSSWSPDGRLDLSPQARLLLDQMYHDDPLFRDASLEAMEIAESLGVASEDSFAQGRQEMRAQVKNQIKAGQASLLADFAAKRLREDARIAAFSISGWDTHQRQERGIRRALGQLSRAILTLKKELGPDWEKTAVLAVTEFGRTARENGTLGTDHGTASTLIAAGGAIRGGKVYGDWPGLDEVSLYDRRDLMPTRDIRAYLGWAMHSLFGVGSTVLESSIFPSLELGSNPKIIS